MPASLVQEIQNTLAIHCREIVYQAKAKGAKMDKQMEIMFKAFHGTEAHASVLDSFIMGTGLYSEAFDKADIDVNRAGNQDRAADGCMLLLKDLLHCDPSSNFAVHDPGFSREAIAVVKGERIAGRNLNDKAMKVLANYKYALKFHKQFVDSRDNNPSGTKLADMLLFVRKKMFVEFRGCKNRPTGAPPKDKDGNEKEFTEEDMPCKWVFNGYMAFALFGPQPIAGETFSSLSEDGKNIATKSRAAAEKEEEAALKARERAVGTGGYIPEQYRRCVSLDYKAQSAFMAQTEHNNSLQTYREELYRLALKEKDSLRQEFEMSQAMASLDKHAKWHHDIIRRMSELRRSIRKYQDKIIELEENKPEQTQAFHDQVGCFNKRRKKDIEFSTTPTRREEVSQMTENSTEFEGGSSTENEQYVQTDDE